MRKFCLFVFLTFILGNHSADAFNSLFCGQDAQNKYDCAPAVAPSATSQEAEASAQLSCQIKNLRSCYAIGPTDTYEATCKSVAAPPDRSTWTSSLGPTFQQARDNALAACQSKFEKCITLVTACDTLAPPIKVAGAQPDAVVAPISFDHAFDFLNDPNFYRMLIITKLVQDVWTGITIGIGILLVIVIFTKRALIINYVIHGKLPYKLPVYGEEIQCLFKRTQRENWYGRVVFGIVVNLAMTHQQLIDIRKYWLGRVVAFDSLRRQRQNQLAKMHYQLAAATKSEAHDKKKFWSRRWATVRTFFRRLFWIFAALFRLLFSFVFIRVTIAKLVRGTIIESHDLTLILQAKDAIEESATYLKEYLETANTFDGRDELV